MSQKGLKKVMGLGEAEKTFLKRFFRFPKYQLYFLDKKHPFSRSVRGVECRNRQKIKQRML